MSDDLIEKMILSMHRSGFKLGEIAHAVEMRRKDITLIIKSNT